MTAIGAPSLEGPISEAELVAGIAVRDEAAFRIAIEQHGKLLHRIAYRMMGEPHEAEDIVQETMLRLWDHAPRLEARGNPAPKLAAWLKRVCINLAIDRLRVMKRNSDVEVPERADATPLADAQMQTIEESTAARALIAQLPQNQRAAIVLTYYEEMSNSDAAEAMEMKIKAFESLLHRARIALRKGYADQQSGGEVV
ncbi:MAG: sigma-70 family RNA polymerase sigma factor [Erythrobacter sp.]